MILSWGRVHHDKNRRNVYHVSAVVEDVFSIIRLLLCILQQKWRGLFLSYETFLCIALR